MMKTAVLAFLSFGLIAYSQGIVGPRPQAIGCPSNTVATPVRNIEADDYVELERTSCFGSCPAYKVRIYADGRVEWQGNRDVFTTGMATKSVAPELAQGLLQKYQSNGFRNLCDRYTISISDGPTNFTTVRIGEPAKRVSNYDNVAPEWLGNLEKEVDKVGTTYEWIMGSWQSQIFAYLVNPADSFPYPRVALVQISSAATDTRPGATPLMIAAGIGDSAEVERLLSGGANPNATDYSGWTPLMYAAGGRSADKTIPDLLAAGANPKARSAMEQTALMAATWPTSSATSKEVKLLIDAGAEVNVQDKNGQTALMFTLSRLLDIRADSQALRIQKATVLRAAGADSQLHDIYGTTAIDRLDANAKRQPPPVGAASYMDVRRILTEQ